MCQKITAIPHALKTCVENTLRAGGWADEMWISDPSIDQKIAQFRDHLREYGLGTHIGPTMHQIF